MITEEKAKKKSCPFGPLNVLAMTSCAEIPSRWPDVCMCDASGCMMWRWDDKPNHDGDWQGYCGLAGVPK